MNLGLKTAVIGDGPTTVVVVHGILGAGRNWRSFCRRLADRRPDLRIVLVDLRNHGSSPPALGPHTLESCVDDLEELGRAEVVIGHSFGGKVALCWARRQPAGLKQAIALDAWPGIADDTSSQEVLGVIASLRTVAVPAAARNAVREQLAARGLSPAIVGWLLTSLKRGDSGWVWQYDLDAIDEMLSDYFRTDLWPWMQSRAAGGPRVDVVWAERSARWTTDALARFATLPAAAQVRQHKLADAGHWLHVDNPDGLTELLSGIVHSV